MIHRFAFLMAVVALAQGAWGVEQPELKSLEARQRFPWNGLVDITVTVSGPALDAGAAAVEWWSFVATNSATGAAIPVTHLTRNGEESVVGGIRTRRYIWDAAADAGAVKIDDVALTVDVSPGYVQLWENGPYWAECNVGATKPEESGYYFWWGDTTGYTRNAANNGWVSVKDAAVFSFKSGNCPTYGKSSAQLQSEGYIDSTGNLVAKYDAATAHLGAPWRMPTSEEIRALVDNCTTTWTTRNGVYGRLVTGKGAYASKSIFLPAAGYGDGSYLRSLDSRGYFWSSTPQDSEYSCYAWYLNFYSGYFCQSDNSRYDGQSVRPLLGFAAPGPSAFPTISAFTTAGREPIDGIIDLNLTISADEWPTNAVTLSFTAVDNVGGTNLTMRTLSYENGASQTITSAGDYHIVWAAAADLGRVALSVTITATLAESGGTNRTTSCETSEIINTRPVFPDPGELGGVQLWENGPYWAECNVGASKPEEYGYYFWWGDTVGYTRSGGTWKWTNNYYYDVTWVSSMGTRMSSSPFSSSTCPTYDKDTSTLQSQGYIDSTGNLVAKYDAATAHLGAPWRMPTLEEIRALVDNCTTTWTTRNGVYGRLVTGKGAYASKSIFLPAAGCGDGSYLRSLGSGGDYWSSTPDSDYSIYAKGLCFASSNFARCSNGRYHGKSVRPLRGFAK